MEQPSLGELSGRDRPYFAARMAGGEPVISGTGRCRLGHRLERGEGDCPDGIFVDWHWDGAALHVENDRYGIYPLFYACHGSEIVVSPSLYQVMRGAFPRTPDTAGLAVFFRLGFFIGEDTPFEHVRVLPPASRLTWRDGRLSLVRREDAQRGRTSAPRSFDEAVDRYVELFGQATARRAPAAGFTVPISGGRDSRHILFELMRQGHVPESTITVRSRPPSANEDIRIARLLAQRFHLHHHEIDRPASFFEANRKDVEVTHLCGSGHTWLLPVAAWLQARRTHTMYDGLAGSVLSGGFQVSEDRLRLFRSGRLTELAQALLRDRGIEPFLRRNLRSAFMQGVSFERAVERLVAELERHADARHPLTSYLFWNRTRRGVSLIPFSMLAHVDTVYCPYLDHDVFDFLTELPPEHTLGNALHDEALRRAYPAYADIPFEDPDAPRQRGSDYSAYYRAAVRACARHFSRNAGFVGSRLLRGERVLAMAARDALKAHCDQPWYLHPALHLLEMERLMSA